MPIKLHITSANVASISDRIAKSPVNRYGVSVLAYGPTSPIAAEIIRKAGGFTRERINEAFRRAMAEASGKKE